MNASKPEDPQAGIVCSDDPMTAGIGSLLDWIWDSFRLTRLRVLLRRGSARAPASNDGRAKRHETG